MSIKSLMTVTVDIDTEVSTKTPTGGPDESWTSKATGVAARPSDPSPDDAKIVYGKFDSVKQKVFYFDTDQSLTLKDRIVLNGINWQVHSVQNQGGELNRLWKAYTQQKPGGN